MLYLPQLIRHVQLILEGMRRAKTRVYLKIGTSGTGGMGLNVPFTHSEERPSRSLLAKASVAGAHSLLLFLMARTPDAPVVKEVKPTAAIAWQRVAFGPVMRGRRPIPRYDAVAPVVLEEALEEPTTGMCERLEDAIESVWLDAGENGLFSLAEFEAISELRRWRSSRRRRLPRRRSTRSSGERRVETSSPRSTPPLRGRPTAVA